MKKLGLWIFIHLSIFSLQAQHSLNGRVDNVEGQPLPYANLQILSSDSAFLKGMTTDSLGRFTSPELKAGKYILSASYIGYVPQMFLFNMPDSDYELPAVVLQTDHITLSEVEVKGSSFIQKKDHLLVIPDKQSVKHSFSGYDLLYNLMIPGLTVNRKEKSVTALSGEATLYINGLKADMREIQNLQPKDIERVEYYVLPATGPFTGDAASINYITKVYNSGGYVTLDAEQNIGYLKGDYNIGAKLSHNHTTYTLFGGHTMRSYDGTEREKEEHILFPNHPIHRTTTHENATYQTNQQYAQFKVSHDTDKHNLYALASFVRNDTPHDDSDELLHYSGNNASTQHSSEASNNENYQTSVRLNGIFNPSEKHQVKMYLNGSYSKNTYDRHYQENALHSHTHVNESFYSFEPYISYMFQPDKNNSYYGRIFHMHNITSSNYRGDYDSWQHLWTGETAALFDYTHLFGDNLTLMVSPGVTWLNYKLHTDKLQSSWNFRTNSWIRYVINSKHWAGLGISMGNNQPGITYLNSVDQIVDSYQVKRGNPLLDNTRYLQYYFMYEGQVNKLNLQCKLWYSKDKHSIYTDYYLEGDKLISSYASDGSFDTANTEVSASYRFSDRLRAALTLGYSYMYVPGRKDLDKHNFKGNLDVNYYIKAFAVNAYFKTQENRLDENTRAFIKQPVSYGFSIRYSRKKWMAEAGTDNPFSKELHYRKQADYGVYRYNQVQTSRIYQQTAYVKLAYTFDFGKKTSRESNDVDRNINSAILKAR